MKIDINKKYRYKNGDLARILCVDAAGDEPVVSVTPFGMAVNHAKNGAHGAVDSPLDLIEVREPREWSVRVALSGNENYREHELITEHKDGSPGPILESRWAVIRVREIID